MQISFDPISAIIGFLTGIFGKKIVYEVVKKAKITFKQKIRGDSSSGVIQSISTTGDVKAIIISSASGKDIENFENIVKEEEKISEDEITKIKAKDDAKTTLETQKKLSVILSKCLELAQLLRDTSTMAWIKRELYSTEEWNSTGNTVYRNVSNRDIFPSYRSVRAKLEIQSGMEVKNIEIPYFLPFSVFELERLVDDAHSTGKTGFVVRMKPPTSWIQRFPKIFKPNKTIPIIISLSEIERTLTQIRKRAHKFLYETG